MLDLETTHTQVSFVSIDTHVHCTYNLLSPQCHFGVIETMVVVKASCTVYEAMATVFFTLNCFFKLLVGLQLAVISFCRWDVFLPTPFFSTLLCSNRDICLRRILFNSGRSNIGQTLTMFLTSRPTAQVQAFVAFRQRCSIADAKSLAVLRWEAFPVSPEILYASWTVSPPPSRCLRTCFWKAGQVMSVSVENSRLASPAMTST
jgi:hypothetical protein